MQINRRVQTFSLGLMLFGSGLAAHAQPFPGSRPDLGNRPVHGRWQMLGQANVDGMIDHDNIVVTAARGTFRAIQIRVHTAAIEFRRVTVHYGDGSNENIQIRSRIPAGGSTRVINLPGQRRIIRSVEFWYAKANWASRRPGVTLYGLQ